MFSNRMAFAAVSLACVAAAGGGAYVATRQSQANNVIAAPGAPVAPAATASSTPSAPVAAPEGASAPAAAPARTATAASAPSAPTSASTRGAVTPAPTKKGPAPAPAVPKGTPSPSRVMAEAQPPAAFPPPPADVQPPPPAPAPEVARQDDVRPLEPQPIEPERVPEKTFDELVVSADSVIGLQLDTALSSERSKVEDRVDARVVRDVRVGSGGHVAIPAGARAIGAVTVVDKGGKMKDRARLGIKFTSIVLADGTRIPINTEVIYRYGDAPQTAQKVGGGAVIGTIIGGIFGGAKGAALGAAVGAGGGAAAQAAGDRSAAEFPAGIQVTARFLSPVTVTVEH